MTTASLVESISVDGIPGAASGTAYFFQPGTTTQATVYQSATGGTVYAQPVQLDANGRSVYNVFATGPVRMMVFSATGILLADVDQENVVTAAQVALNSSNWTSTSLDSALTSVSQSFGAGDGQVKSPASGTVSRTLQAKLYETYVSVADFGAKGDGINDDTAPINAALNYIKSIGSGELRFPVGTFKITSQLSFSSVSGSLRVIGSGRATVIVTTAGVYAFGIAATSLDAQSLSFSVCNGFDAALSDGGNFTNCSMKSDTGTLIRLTGSGTTNYIASSVALNAAGALFTTLVNTTQATSVTTAVGCLGNVSGGLLTAIGVFGTKTSAATGSLTVVGGSGNVTPGSNLSPTVLLPTNVAGYAFTSDSASDKLYTFSGNGTANILAIQGMVVLQQNTIGGTVTWNLTAPSPGRFMPAFTIRFFNNTAGACTWTTGGGFTLRAAAPAPGAGASVYITFMVDHVANTLVEIART